MKVPSRHCLLAAVSASWGILFAVILLSRVDAQRVEDLSAEDLKAIAAAKPPAKAASFDNEVE
ncbi:MAG: hypothetical protein IIC53_07180 [Proteobacteria bacterium]|nr:hypothetical protein [Pseudomonadota bacterium]